MFGLLCWLVGWLVGFLGRSLVWFVCSLVDTILQPTAACMHPHSTRYHDTRCGVAVISYTKCGALKDLFVRRDPCRCRAVSTKKEKIGQGHDKDRGQRGRSRLLFEAGLQFDITRMTCGDVTLLQRGSVAERCRRTGTRIGAQATRSLV